MLPLDRSVNCTAKGAWPEVVFAVKSAVGGDGAAGRTDGVSRSGHQRHNHRFIPFNFQVVNRRNRQVAVRQTRGEWAGGGQLLVIDSINSRAGERPAHLNRLRSVAGPVEADDAI